MKVAVAGMITIAAVVIALAVGHVTRRQEAIRLGYDLSDALTELRHAQEENRRLRLERSVLTSPDRISGLAAQMGMHQPTEGQVRIVRPDASALAELRAPDSGSSQ